MIKRNPRIKRNLEIWKSIEGFPDYKISNMGRVKSLERWIDRKNNSSMKLSEKLLKPNILKRGYHAVSLSNQGIQPKLYIHSLVIEHFGKPKPSPKHECNHKDGDKSNNWDTNLEWMTGKQNIQHAIKTGLINQRGENSSRAKLTEKELGVIRKLYKTGRITTAGIGAVFGITQSNVSTIINHRSWRIGNEK